MRMGEVEVTNTFNDLCRPETLAPAQSEWAVGEDVLDSGTTAAVDEDALVARQIYGRRRRWKRPWIRKLVKQATHWHHRAVDVSVKPQWYQMLNNVWGGWSDDGGRWFRSRKRSSLLLHTEGGWKVQNNSESSALWSININEWMIRWITCNCVNLITLLNGSDSFTKDKCAVQGH